MQWRWLDNRKNLHGAGYLWAKPVLPLLLVAIGFHWAAEGLERSGASFSTNSDSSRARRAQTLQRLLHFDLAAPHLKLFWPRAVFGGVGAFLILLVLIPLFYRRETSAGSKVSRLWILFFLFIFPAESFNSWRIFSLHRCCYICRRPSVDCNQYDA